MSETFQFKGSAGSNPIDRGEVVGRPVDRVDGPLKVSGRACYSYDYHDVAPNALVGFIREAGIARGRIARLDTRAAERAPGVIAVITHRNAPPQGKREDKAFPVFDSDRIRHYGEPVAFVVAETFEEARDAAHLIDVDYAAVPGRYDMRAERAKARNPISTTTALNPPDTYVGDFAEVMAAAPIKIDVEYSTAAVTHAMMEPHATLARWNDDQLTLWTAHQIFDWALRDLPVTLLVPKEKIRLISSFVGGGFGGKLYCQPEAMLSAIAARMLGRPVRTALTRPQIMNMTRHGPATIQRVRLGAGLDGRIQAIGHDGFYANAEAGGEPEEVVAQTRLLYAGANRRATLRQIVVDWPIGSALRAPGERTGLVALEGAMDELAHATRIDPVDLRARNDTPHDPEKGPSRPFATRSLVECMRIGAERFGWASRNPEPGQTREGRWLVGLGMAAAFRRNQVKPSGARVTVTSAGKVVVESATTDIGVGTYTIMAQTAAEMLGVPIEAIDVRLADSTMPHGAGGGGSWGGNSATAGLYVACMAMRRQLAQRAGFNEPEVVFAKGRLTTSGQSILLAEAVGATALVAEGDIIFEKPEDKAVSEAAFGAHFCEVGVDRYTAEIRVRRWLTVADIGRVLNPKTARSQLIGGITFGIGAAMMEECVMDSHRGLFINHDLAQYHVPCHADIPDIEVHFLDKLEPTSSPMKAKGTGELGNCGSGPALVNAVFNATGVRIRNLPITTERLLPGLEAGA